MDWAIRLAEDSPFLGAISRTPLDLPEVASSAVSPRVAMEGRICPGSRCVPSFALDLVRKMVRN